MDHSIYEKQSLTRRSQNYGMSFGRITQVFPEERLCEVKTFMGQGLQDDNAIPKCQWISMDAHPDGDESTSIPRVNSYGLVFFIDGQPFIFGFFSPLTGTGSASIQTGDKEEINEGDKVIKTVGKNKIILRAHGEVEVHSTDVCRTIYFPDKNIINTLCRNYELRADGGSHDWINIEDSGNTISSLEYRTDIKRTNVIIEERGYVTEEVISRTVIGAGTADGVDQPVWSRTILRTGETEHFIRAPGATSGHKLTITPDGATKLDVAGKTTVDIKASGETTIDVGPGKATVTISPAGAITVTAEGQATVTAKAGITMTTDGDLTATAKGNATIDCAKATIKAKSNALKGGAVAAHAANNDPITGIPLQPVGGVEFA